MPNPNAPTAMPSPMRPDQFAGWVRNRVPSREAAEEVRRVARILEDDNPEDAAMLDRLADFLLDLRQAARGGRRNVYGSRHWNGANIHGED